MLLWIVCYFGSRLYILFVGNYKISQNLTLSFLLRLKQTCLLCPGRLFCSPDKNSLFWPTTKSCLLIKARTVHPQFSFYLAVLLGSAMVTVLKLAVLIATLFSVILAVQVASLSIPLIQKIHTGHDLAKFWAKQAQSSDADKPGSKMFQYIYRSKYGCF
jgi:hypothetical protein